MSATLQLVWDRLHARGCHRATGHVDTVSIAIDPLTLDGIANEIRKVIVVRARDEILVLPEGHFVVNGGALGSGTWSLLGAST